MNKIIIKINGLLLLAFIAVLFASCGSKTEENNPPVKVANESAMLLDFFVQNGDYINSPNAPAILNAADVYNNRKNNMLVIDLRSADQFDAGHIENAINLAPSAVFDYFTKIIDASSFDQIVFVCAKGQLSSYVSGLMRLSGYNNTFSMRFGMSSWNKELAEQGWDKVVGDELNSKLSYTAFPKPAKTTLPKIETGGTTALEIERLRAHELLAMDQTAFLVKYNDVIADPNKYYIVSYFDEEEYNNLGHLENAVQYSPRVSLLEKTDLLTLPVNKPIAIYCYTGQQSANVAAYLRMLGYDAYSVTYGANSFMNSTLIAKEKRAGRYWSDIHKNELPLVSGSQTSAPSDAVVTEIKSVQGGC